jgi:hypothetical protein
LVTLVNKSQDITDSTLSDGDPLFGVKVDDKKSELDKILDVKEAKKTYCN